MSNPVHLVAMTFDAHVKGTKSYGFTLSDNEAQCFVDGEESPIKDDLELLKFAITCDGYDVMGILGFVNEHEKGININNQYYEWEEIKQYFEDYGE